MSGYASQKESPFGVDFYTRIAPIYDPLVGPFLRPVRRAVSRIARDRGCRRILDIGCGTGEQAELLANEGFTVAGLDLSPAMLARARGRGRPGAAYFLGTAEALPFHAASFDCVIISLALHEMGYATAVRVTDEALRVLASGGKFIVFDYLRPRNFISNMSLALMHIAERIAGKRHFENFKHFVNLGGLETFLEGFPLSVISSRGHFGGAMGLVVSQKRG
ncbi:MAG: methyltransferase domain-containing protein [Syntrophobacteraceae bacterium]